jgi:hypothetical protein
MHRFRSWSLDPSEWRTQRNRLLPIEGGDGSTLNLDFTSGVLDPRLTLTRSTNATFINSQGLVEFAAANILRNSVMAGGSTSGLSAPTSWSAGVSGESYRTQIVIDGCEQWKQVASSARPYMTIAIQNTELAVGVQYVASVYVDSFTTGTLFTTLDNFLSYNEPSGTTVSSVTWVAPNGSTGASQPLAIGRIQLRFVLSAIGASGFQLRIGIGVQNTATGTVEFSRPQCERGTVAKPFLANTSTSAANYNTPRFDYDPTSIGTPRGLLLEGSASNLVNSSVDLSNATYWSQIGPGIVVQGSQGPSPDGLNNATKIAIGTTGNYIEAALSLAANTVYTLSCFVKKVGTNQYASLATGTGSAWVGAGGGVEFNFNNPNASTILGTIVGWGYTAFRDGWYRVTYTVTTSATPANAKMRLRVDTVVQADGYLVYGAQVETGSGASSYIPTGASQGNRAEDTCYMDGTNFSSWYSASTQTGTLFADITHSALSNANGGIELGNGLGSQTSSNRVSLRRDGVIVDGVSAITVSPTGASQRFKTAIAFAPGTGNTAACRNGGTVSNPAQAAGTLSGINALKFYIDASPALRPYGWIRQVKVWSINLSNATLQAITTL